MKPEIRRISKVVEEFEEFKKNKKSEREALKKLFDAMAKIYKNK